jgi:micrococcal nuclease
MNDFWERNRNFWAIIIGALIIGGFIYLSAQVLSNKNWADFGLQNSNQNSGQTQVGGMSDIPITPKVATDVGHPQNVTACGADDNTDDNTIVTKVIDGDTVVVEGGYHVRLLGIDADESGYPCYALAKTRLEDLVLGKQVKLEKDKTDLDQYGRCLRYIFINNTNVDVQLVREGLAVARFYDDVKYKSEITEAEKYAQQNQLGCKWAQ